MGILSTIRSCLLATTLLLLPFAALAEANYGERFNEIIEKLRSSYVDESKIPSDEELFRIAVQAILKQVGDTHGAYFDPEAAERFQQQMNPTGYTGVGIVLAPYSQGNIKGAMILQFFDNSPLKFAGPQVGDVIVGANEPGSPMVSGENLRELVKTIKGPAGTNVVLHVKRGTTDLGQIEVPRVHTRAQYVFVTDPNESGFITIRITQFAGTVVMDLLTTLNDRGLLSDQIDWRSIRGDDPRDTAIKRITELKKLSLSPKVKGVALDLRNDPGGSLFSAVGISDMWLPKDMKIVTVDHREDDKDIVYMSTDYQLFKGILTVGLFNGGSASASEIVAGALQSHKIVDWLGRKTFGKGSVQTYVGISGGAGFKNTVALYYPGTGVRVDGVGLTPNMEIVQPNAPGSGANQRLNRHIIFQSLSPEIDHQLNAAYHYLRLFSTTYSKNSGDSHVAGMNVVHGTKTEVKKPLCDKYGLRGCPVPHGVLGARPD